jgi:hypothetical protein
MGHVMTRSGAPAVVESIVERVYPTEFDPAELNQSLEGPITKENRIATHATPTAFQTRNTGLTIKVTPQVGPDGQTIDMNIMIDGTEFVGNDVHGQGPATVTMPNFYSRSMPNQITATSGEDVLLGITQPNEESTQRELVFVRPTALKATTIDDARKRWEAIQAKADGDVDHVRNIVTLVEYLEVPLTKLYSRMRQPAMSADATALRRSLDPLITSDKVKRTAISYLPTKSANRTRSHSGNERIYGVEAAPRNCLRNLKAPSTQAFLSSLPLTTRPLRCRKKA